MRGLMIARMAVIVVWVIALAMELPCQFGPTLPELGRPTLFIVADSVSAGISDADKVTWPKLLSQEYGIDIHDFSKMGATVASARKQVRQIENAGGLVLLEIGGNDLLGTTTPDQFEERLDQLLTDVCQANRTVVMVELPLPPFANRFGMIQRRLARKYEIFLVPKRKFVGVLTTTGATVDGIHLSRHGQTQMGEMVWEVIAPAYTTK